MTDAKTPSVNLSPSDYVIIGGTGDLALRKILPALFWRYLDGQITSDYRIAAASRRYISPEDYAGMLRPFCEDAFSGGGASEDDADQDQRDQLFGGRTFHRAKPTQSSHRLVPSVVEHGDGGRLVAGPGRQKAAELLARLVLSGGTLGRFEALRAALGGDRGSQVGELLRLKRE